MKKKFGVLFGFFCLAILDSIFAYTFPLDFTYTRFSIIWHFYLTGLLVFVRDKPWLNRLLIGAFAGILFDLFFTSTFPACFFLYGFLGWFSGFFQLSTKSRQALLYISLIFLADFLPYLFQRLLGQTNVTFIRWFYYMELISVLISCLICIAMIHLDLIMDRFYAFQARVNQNQAVKKSAIKR